MSDSSKVFGSVKQSLTKLFPKMSGHEASHFGTLLHMITGMVISKHSHLPKIAGKVKTDIKRESQVIKFRRWLSNDRVKGELYFLPFLEKLLPILVKESVQLIFDGSVVGRDSACLMASIIYRNRAIPLGWLVVEGKKGHFCEDYHIELLKIVKDILPDDVEVTLIGDGEFDGINFLETIEDCGWYFVVRTAPTATFNQTTGPLQLPKTLKAGDYQSWSDVYFTRDCYGELMVLIWKENETLKTIVLISNHTSAVIVKSHYTKRQIIETFFSDIKTRGFHLHKSHISELGRLANLMIVGCIAYIWLVLLGQYALNKGLNTLFHRTERCDLSLLQLGFRYIEYLINENLMLPKINFLRLQ